MSKDWKRRAAESGDETQNKRQKRDLSPTQIYELAEGSLPQNSIPQVQENHRSSIAALPANNNPMQEGPQLSMAARFSSAEMNPDQSTPFKARRESLEWISLNRNHSESLYTRGSAQMIQIPTGSTGKSSLALEMSYHLSEKIRQQVLAGREYGNRKADLGKQIERILEQDRKILTSREHKGRTRMKRKE
jgi:hypothetical protein